MPKKPKTTDWEFMVTWMEAYREGVFAGYVAKKLGVSPTTITWRKDRLLRSGIDLPALGAQKNNLFSEEDVAEYNTYIRTVLEDMKRNPKQQFPCGHPRQRSNSVPNGKRKDGRPIWRCRICKKANWDKRTEQRKERKDANL